MKTAKREKFGTILLADSNPTTNNIMKRHIENEQLAEEIIVAKERTEQEEILKTGTIDVMVVGLKYKGIGIVKSAKEFSPRTKIVICSGSVNSEDLAAIIRPDVFVKKPVIREEFIAAVRRLL